MVTYTCNDGYTLNGVKSRLCQLDGTLAGKAPTCDRGMRNGIFTILKDYLAICFQL